MSDSSGEPMIFEFEDAEDLKPLVPPRPHLRLPAQRQDQQDTDSGASQASTAPQASVAPQAPTASRGPAASEHQHQQVTDSGTSQASAPSSAHHQQGNSTVASQASGTSNPALHQQHNPSTTSHASTTATATEPPIHPLERVPTAPTTPAPISPAPIAANRALANMMFNPSIEPSVIDREPLVPASPPLMLSTERTEEQVEPEDGSTRAAPTQFPVSEFMDTLAETGIPFEESDQDEGGNGEGEEDEGMTRGEMQREYEESGLPRMDQERVMREMEEWGRKRREMREKELRERMGGCKDEEKGNGGGKKDDDEDDKKGGGKKQYDWMMGIGVPSKALRKGRASGSEYSREQ